jgi:Fe-S-cluster containining protein
MSEPRRILALMSDLTSSPDYVSGRRAYPRTLGAPDATLITRKLHEAIDEGTEVRARKASESGYRIACAPGCNACCEHPILVWLPEVLRVVEHLERPENAGVKQAFLLAYPRWRAAIGEDVERIAELTATGDREGHVRAHVTAWKKRALCAFNHDGLCSIYEARPIVCRNHHALDTAEHCRVDDESDVPPALLAFQPLDDFIQRARSLGMAMHHALGGGRQRTVALCQAVYERLTSPPTSPAPGPR